MYLSRRHRKSGFILVAKLAWLATLTEYFERTKDSELLSKSRSDPPFIYKHYKVIVLWSQIQPFLSWDVRVNLTRTLRYFLIYKKISPTAEPIRICAICSYLNVVAELILCCFHTVGKKHRCKICTEYMAILLKHMWWYATG